jgi:hypothetical protein
LRLITEYSEAGLFKIKNYFDNVFFDALDGGKLVRNIIDLDGGNGRTAKAR